MRPIAPPLWTWVAASVLAAAVLAGLALDPTGRADPEKDLNLARLDRAAASGKPFIAILGDSKVQCAVGFDSELQSRLAALGVPAAVVRVTRQGAVFEDLEPALDRLTRSRPDVVLIEEDLLLYSHPRVPDPETVSWSARADRAVRVRLGLPRIRFNVQGPNSGPCGQGQASNDPAADSADFQRGWAAETPSTAAGRAAYLDRLGRLKARGATVALINLPRSPAAERVFPDRLKEAAATTLAQLQAVDGLGRLAPSAAPPQSAYADLGHMNAEGRRLYMDWLTPQLAGLAKTAHD